MQSWYLIENEADYQKAISRYEAIREAAPEDLGLEVLDGDDIGQAVATGGAGGKRLVEDLVVAEILNVHLDVGILLVEPFNRRFERTCRDIPAPDRQGGRLRQGGTGSESDDCGSRTKKF